MTGFAWCCMSFIKAKLAGSKATQLNNESRELMDLLHGRLWWARSVIMQYPNLAPILLPDVPTTYRFAKFDREFEFNYYSEDDVWMLSFVCFIHPPPKKSRANGKNGSNNAAKRNRRWRPGDSSSSRASLRDIWDETKPLIEERWQWLQAQGDRTLEEIQVSYEWLKDRGAQIVERAWERVEAAWRMARTKFEAIRRDLQSAHVRDVFAEAHLERRLVQVAPGFSVMLNTFVSDRLPWEAFLFGRLIEEELLLD